MHTVLLREKGEVFGYLLGQLAEIGLFKKGIVANDSWVQLLIVSN